MLEESELHRLVRSSRPDRLDDRWLNKCRHLFMATLRQSTQDSLPLSRLFKKKSYINSFNKVIFFL
jgi:hypothetical protein